MLVAYTFGVVLVVGAVIALITNSWWVLAAAIAVHLGASAFFLALTFRAIESGSKPDPVEEAHIEAGDRDQQRPDPLTRSGRREDHEVVL
jgi:hypothetical protein